jgi:Uma2 family endonuclease
VETHDHTSHERQPAIVLLPRSLKVTREQFEEVCRLNRDWRLERTAEGDIVIMPPTGALTGKRSMRIGEQLSAWARKDGSGVAFDSSTGFELPNGATRSPDAAWIARTRIAKLTREQIEGFLPLCPDFVIELRSPSDRLSVLQEKLGEYVANGAHLGWLIDPAARSVHVYRPGVPTRVIEDAETISADPELPGFLLDVREIWEAQL